jgi:uncharacterized protein
MRFLSPETESAFRKIKNFLESINSAAIAFSGGTDSSLLLYIASAVPGLKIKAYTVKNIMIPEDEIESAINFAKTFNIDHQIIENDILSYEKISINLPDRCYHCKKLILSKIIDEASNNRIKTVLEGSHSDDINDFRPGLKAIRELGVLSPLNDAGFNKKMVHELSAHLSLPSCGRESYPCLATRIPTGTQITPELLQKAEAAEKIIKSFGFKQVRARIHGNILRIEIAEKMLPHIISDNIRKKLYNELSAAGFTFITLDMVVTGLGA